MEQPPVKNELRPRTLRFGAFEVDPRTQELRKEGICVRLPAQSIQILLMLLETPGQLVNREELRNKLWPEDTFVDFDHGLNAAVNRLREALGDSADNPKFVETLPRRGYRFIAPVGVAGEKSGAAQPISAELNTSVPESSRPVEPSQRLSFESTQKSEVQSATRIGNRWRVAAIGTGLILCAAMAFGIWFILPHSCPN